MSKYTLEVSKTEKLGTRKGDLPEDYHCRCKYCTKKYLGEVYDVKNDTYYSQLARNRYYVPNKGDHIAPGHWSGYRWAIQRFTKRGDWVFDPTVGTGTAIVEAVNNGRNAAGIELEFHELTQKNIDFQYVATNKPKDMGKYNFWSGGNARDLSDFLQEHTADVNAYRKKIKSKEPKLEKEFLSLVVNGTPYPTIAGISSDGYERAFSRDIPDRETKVRDYQVEENFGAQRLNGNYWPWVTQMYLDCVPFMKKNAKMAIVVKDLVQKKEAWKLHEMVVDRILERTNDLKFHGVFLQRHIPSTMWMNTYPKRFPEVKIPLYQTGIVLAKK
jgi:hypothetical protein